MWQCTSNMKTNKRAIRIFLVIAVLFCILLLYVNMDNFQPTFRKMSNDTSSTNPYSKILDFSIENIIPSSNLENNRVTRIIKETSNKHMNAQILDWTTDYFTDATSSTTSSSRNTKANFSEIGKNQNINKDTGVFRNQELSKSTNWVKIQHRAFPQKTKLPMSLLFPSFQNFDKRAYDIMSMDPIPFDRAFKNPCFRGIDSAVPIKDRNLHCLPYFYIIGVKKSGTSDLYSRLRRHPEICPPSFPKESQWFSRYRFGIRSFSLSDRKLMSIIQRGIDPRKVEFFASLFDSAASCILRSPSRYANESLYYNRITIEASPSTLHMHTKWELLPGNENLQEPRYTNFNYIKHITPNAKIIILFRDPTSRLYSDFLHSTRGKYGESSGTVFHKHVVELIKSYNDCSNYSSQRSCVYNNTLKKALRKKRVELADSFNAGFYAVFMRDLLDVFGTSQVLPILMSNYVTQMKETLEGAFNFLDMSPVDSLTMQRILKLSTKNVSAKKKRKTSPMLESTKAILDEFYKPYNKDMAELVNDERYMFLK